MPAGRDNGSGRHACPSIALYVHVPFCRARCAYCDFNTYTGLRHLMPAYREGMHREIETACERWGPMRVSSIYFGGGTPSLLPLNLMADLIAHVRATFDLSHCEEFAIEANPGTVSGAYLSGLRQLGVDRLSLGAQSAHEEELHMLGRIHSWSDVVGAVEAAREAGLENINLDLLFGLPGQSVDGWEGTLKRALELEPQHLSLYGLSVEEGTPLAERIASGDLAAPDEECAATMYELAEELLAAAGFFHYEISSWARIDHALWPAGRRWWPARDAPGAAAERSEEISSYVCRHNLTYWRNEPWLGIGAGAHSWLTAEILSRDATPSTRPARGERWANVGHPQAYVAADSAALRRSVEEIDLELEMGETMMLGLRLAEGVRAERFEARFGVALADVFGAQLTNLRKLGLLVWDGSVARLTGRGRLLGNRVFERFI